MRPGVVIGYDRLDDAASHAKGSRCRSTTELSASAGAHLPVIDSSAALAVFISAEDRPENWVETGRAFQRLALEATRLGLAHAHVNQAVEVRSVRAELARHLGLAAGRPSLIVRIGRARPLPYSLRRPVEVIATLEQLPT